MTILTKQPLSLLHFDTDLLDTSGKVWTQIRNPSITSTNKMFGIGSMSLTNVDGLTLLNHTLDVSKDFTVSWREYLSAIPSDNGGGVAINYGDLAGLLIGNNYGGYKTVFCGSGTTPAWDLISNYKICPYADVLNKWVHYELSYQSLGGVLRLFKDGLLLNTWSGITLYNGSKKPADKNIKIGYLYNNGQNCYIDELMVTQECLHTTNFTPPTSAYEVSLPYWLAKTKDNPSYWSYKTNSWVDVGLPTTDADIATLFVNQGTNTCPTQQQLELLGTGVNRPNRCCYQTVVATQPTININAVPTPKVIKPTELLPIKVIEGIDSVSITNTISTGINDETGKIWSKTGTAQLSNTQSKFGGNSLYLNGNSYIQTPSSEDFNFGTGDFTIEWWEYNISNTQFSNAIQIGSIEFKTLALGVYINGNRTVFCGNTGTNNNILNGFSLGSFELNKWCHFALVRSGNTFYGFKNGTLTSTSVSNASLTFSNYTCTIGDAIVQNGQNYKFNGYIDEVRIINGVAKYTTNFTPSTAPYTKDVDTISLLHFDSSVAKLKLAVTLDLVTYYKFNGSAWEVIDINTNQDNMMDIATVTSINRSQWDLLTNGTASGIAFAYYLDISGTGDTVKIDKTSLVVDLKGEWNSAIKGTDFRYGYPANDRLKVTLLTTGNYKINYVGG